MPRSLAVCLSACLGLASFAAGAQALPSDAPAFSGASPYGYALPVYHDPGYTAPQAALAAAVEVEAWAQTVGQSPPLSVDLSAMPVLGPGQSSDSVRTLRVALEERGFLAPPNQPQDFEPAAAPVQVDLSLYDGAVEEAVRAAQRFHGLVEDGKAGPQLYLNLGAMDATMAADLAAWGSELRWHAEQARLAGHRKIIVVNIPSFTLKAIDLETGDTLVETRVIVGKPSSKTPLFTTNIVNLKYNPDWTPPPSLARKGKRYVAAGPNNPLGRVRFSTDNHVNIYLHHTNEPGLFDRPARALSAGCVRVERWDDLAAFVANSDVAHVHGRVDTRKTVFDKVEAVPVVMTYSLVDVSAGRAARFPDVYRAGSRATAPAHLK